jgi:hypothetical protein
VRIGVLGDRGVLMPLVLKVELYRATAEIERPFIRPIRLRGLRLPGTGR